MYKPGDLVRHKNKPEWGLGRVTGETGEGKVLVKFAARAGDVLLTPEGAEKFLVPDTGVIAAAMGPRPAAPAPSPAPSRRTPCVNCAVDLQAIRVSPDGLWRSCPSCSARSGRHHVFLLASSAFDELDAPLADDVPPPHPQYGWCRACRAGARASGFKTCSQIR
jgi:hypothetical protein